MNREGSRQKKRMGGVFVLALSVLLVGCSQTPTVGPEPTSSATTSSPAPTESSAALAFYYVADTAQGLRLYREFHKVAIDGTAIESALSHLLTTEPLDPDYVNLWPADSKLNSVVVNGSTAKIDISFSKLNVGAEGEQRAIDQLVWTATAADPTITRITFLRDGKQTESFAGHVDTTGSFKRALTYEVLAPVWITSAEEGATVKSPLTFGGLAQVFEANVQWQVLQGTKVIAQGATTAGEAAPARTPWKLTVTNLAAGKYTIRAFASSAKDGSLVAEDTKTITLVK